MKRLKLFFACLLMAVLSIGQVWAADYTYTFSAFDQGSPVEFSVADPALTITLTVAPSGQGNTTKPQWNAGSSQARVYAGGRLSIAIENATIDKLVFDYVVNASSGTKPTITGVAGSTSAGTWDAENKTWEGSDTEVIFSTSGSKGNVGFKSIKVYYTPDGSGSNQPNITASPVSAKYAVGDVATALSVTAEASAGDLHYAWKSNTTNSTTEGTITAVGTDEATYTPPTASAGTTYYFCVVTDANGSATSSIAEIDVKTPQTIAQIMPTSSTEGDEFLLNDVTVTYANGGNVYVKDATGYIMIYSAISEAENGKVLQGLCGKAKLYSGLPEISSVTKVPTVTAGDAVSPEELTTFPTSSDLNKYVVLNGVTFTSAQTLSTTGDKENITGSFKNTNLTIRNNFKIAASLAANTPYQVLGVVQIFNATIQIYPISFTEQADPTVTLSPAVLDFGTIGIGDAVPGALTFAVAGSNLTENLSASLTEGSEYYSIEVTEGSIEKDANNEVDATITVTPKAAINESAGTKAGTITISGSGLSETVSLTTEVKEKHAINFNTGGVSTISPVNVREGATYDIIQAPTFDPAKICEYGTFVGWTTASVIPVATVKPALVSQVTMAETDITLYAVYSKIDGGAGSTEETAEVTIADYADAENWENGVQYSSVVLDENITATASWVGTGNKNTGKYYTNGEDWRFYQNETAKLTINAVDGCTLKSATLTFSIGNTGELSGAGGAVTSAEAYTISGNEYEFSVGNSGEATNGQVKFTALSITYDKVNGTLNYSLEANCCTPHDITIASGIENGNVSADLAEACEGKTVTLTPTADPAYHFESWNVTYNDGEEKSITPDGEGKFTMPAYDVTVSALFAHDQCTNLSAPTLNGTIEPTYNSATIAWNEVTGAVAYAVTVTNHTTSDVVFSDNVNALSKALTGLEPETQYDYSVMAVGDGVDKCADGNGLLEDNFTTVALPTVQLYYVKKQGADPIDGGTHTLGVEFDLVPSDLSCTKTFVGWTDEANKDYTHATEAPSVLLNKYTFTSEAAVTLYAVYAEVGPGTTTYTLTPATSVEEGVYVIAAYDENYKALTGGISAGKLVNETTGFTIDGENKIVSLPDDACEFTFTAVTGGYSIQKPNDDYLGYTSTSDNNKLAFGSYATLVWSVNSNSKEGYPDGGVSLTTSAYKVSANASAGSDTWVRGYKSSGSIYNPIYLFKKATAAGTATNYATTCADAPVATPDPASIDAAAAGTSGTITMVYDNVNTSALAVALYNDAEGNVAFTGDWLTASLSSTNISYTVNPNTTYAARTAYIKLTAPETTGATDPAVVIIPVTQAKYIPEFASLAALVAADPAIPSGTDVKVSFSHIKISDDIAIVSSQRKGVYLDVKAENDKDIEIYYAATPYVPESWVKNGYVSATDLVATWTYYNQYSNDQWELVPVSGFNWENDLVYEAPSAAQITVTPSGDVNFGTITQGAALPADKKITVTLTNVAAATATLGGTNPDAFSITPASPAALTTSGDITISVVSTATVGTYSATLTITDDASVAEPVEVNISLKIEEAETPVSTTSEWVAATDGDLVDGAEVLITGVKNAVTFAMGVDRGNNRAAVAGTLDGDVFTPGENTMSFILVAQEEGKFALRTSNGKYLYAAHSSSNYLKTRAAIEDGNAKWTLTATSAIANGSNTNETIRFNSSNNPEIFSCYADETKQADIQLYVPKPAPAPDYETVRSGLEIDRYYTVCLPKKVTAIKGASFWTLNNKSQDGATAYLEEETNNLPFDAGKPFIIQATAEKLEVVYEGAATEDAGTNGALHGTLVYMNAAALAAAGSDIYMLFSNELRPVGENNHLDANRAYVKLNELDAVAEAPQSAPGRRVRAMPMQPQVATGFEAAEANEAPRKVLINGELFIIRGEKMYDAKGQLVK